MEWKWPIEKIQTYQNKAKNLCTISFLCLTWTVNANSFEHNIIVIKEIMFFLAVTLVGWIGGDFVYRKVAAKNIFLFQRLCRLLWGYHFHFVDSNQASNNTVIPSLPGTRAYSGTVSKTSANRHEAYRIVNIWRCCECLFQVASHQNSFINSTTKTAK